MLRTANVDGRQNEENDGRGQFGDRFVPLELRLTRVFAMQEEQLAGDTSGSADEVQATRVSTRTGGRGGRERSNGLHKQRIGDSHLLFLSIRPTSPPLTAAPSDPHHARQDPTGVEDRLDL